MNSRSNRSVDAPLDIGSESESLDYNLYCRVTRRDWLGSLRPPAGQVGSTIGPICEGEGAIDGIVASILLAHVEASQFLSKRRDSFFQVTSPQRTPFVIAVAGAAAYLGEPSIVRVLDRALRRHPSRPTVGILDARRFNVRLEHGEELPVRDIHYLPAATDGPALLEFLVRLKGGGEDAGLLLAQRGCEFSNAAGTKPDILLLYGPTLLSESLHGQRTLPFIFDYFDFSIYVDTADCHLAAWFERPRSPPTGIKLERWLKAVRRNLAVHVKPTRSRADLILRIGENCEIEDALIRKI